MLEKLLNFERDFFLYLNSLHTPFFDGAVFLYSGLIIWIPLILFFLFVLIYKKPLQVWLPIIISVLTLSVAGIVLSELIFKPYFSRFRPTFHPDFMDQIRILYEYTGGGEYGFTSGHSAFAFGFATFTSFLFRYKPYIIVIFLWAIGMAYSRIYLGVHFISDVAAGALIGIVLGIGTYYLYRRLVMRRLSLDLDDPQPRLYSEKRMKLITLVMVGYILLFILLNEQIIKLLSIS